MTKREFEVYRKFQDEVHDELSEAMKACPDGLYDTSNREFAIALAKLELLHDLYIGMRKTEAGA